MKDKLHRFIRDNREAFDTEIPSDDLWEKISQKLPQNNTDKSALKDLNTRSKRREFAIRLDWRIAASVALLVGLAFYGYQLNQQYRILEQPTLALSNPTYARQVSQYAQLIETKRVELRRLTQSDPMLYKEFSTELNQLEASYQRLKADLPQNPNQEVLIQAMIQNLQWQIDLLNQQLGIIQRIKQKSKHENDKIM
ncbi:MAG: hypothetical protein ACK4GN_00690 [Runella sp.]